ncbi:hypothetical protein C2845_PM09G21450 [Panicum miliaceum]|uniref:Uncharacterized protein n=1 Tax=Panicum miliaceum TaxID=4540 RepID=A0A3L6S4B4_PANMI|nr:hypothetical protein C2845_PM09G21450 [Panicum miliaceum]
MAEWRGGGRGGRWRGQQYSEWYQNPPFFYKEGFHGPRPYLTVPMVRRRHLQMQAEGSSNGSTRRGKVGLLDPIRGQTIQPKKALMMAKERRTVELLLGVVQRETSHVVEECPVKNLGTIVPDRMMVNVLGFYNIEVPNVEDRMMVNVNNCGKVSIDTGEINDLDLDKDGEMDTDKKIPEGASLDKGNSATKTPPPRQETGFGGPKSKTAATKDMPAITEEIMRVVLEEGMTEDQEFQLLREMEIVGEDGDFVWEDNAELEDSMLYSHDEDDIRGIVPINNEDHEMSEMEENQ